MRLWRRRAARRRGLRRSSPTPPEKDRHQLTSYLRSMCSQAALQGSDPDVGIAMALPLDLAVADTAPSFGHVGTKLPVAERARGATTTMA